MKTLPQKTKVTAAGFKPVLARVSEDLYVLSTHSLTSSFIDKYQRERVSTFRALTDSRPVTTGVKPAANVFAFCGRVLRPLQLPRVSP
jgi:hypothetical protein